jgi:hypothetical protein
MGNPVMNYNQFMSAFKGAAAKYSGKANVANGDATGNMKVNQQLTDGPVKGKGTAALDKYTKSYMANVKKKNSGIRK